jgi:hypothetical protein
VREQLQDFHDRGVPPGGAAADHLADCPSCAGFQAFLARLGAEAREAVDAPLAGLPAPDAEAARRRAAGMTAATSAAAARPGRLALFAAAAAVVVVLGVGGGVLGTVQHRRGAALAAAVGAFVDGLYESPALEGAGYWPAGGAGDLDALLADIGEGL